MKHLCALLAALLTLSGCMSEMRSQAPAPNTTWDEPRPFPTAIVVPPGGFPTPTK